MRPSLIGATVERVEDDRLLTGRAAYLADIRLPGMLEAVFVRSQVAHGLIESVDIKDAVELEGVRGVFTAADLEDVEEYPDFLRDTHSSLSMFPLCRSHVRYVGTPVAVVVATDRYRAEDAAELVDVEIGELPVVTSIDSALAPESPLLFEDWPDNVLNQNLVANPEVDREFEGRHVLSGQYCVQRHSGVPLETRGVVAEYRDGQLTVWTSTQIAHILRTMLSYMLPVAEQDIRVVTPDVGGGFGVKAEIYWEEIVVPWLAMRTGVPVRWVEDRAEHMVATAHARETRVDVEAAVDDEGIFHAVRGTVYQDTGSGEIYPAGTATAYVTAGGLTGAYRIPHSAVSVRCVVTNKTPSGAYRGFGAPEASFAIERLMDKAAKHLAIDRLEIRRRNILQPSDLPLVNAVGAVIDSGSHAAAFERIVSLTGERLAYWKTRFDGVPGVRIGGAPTNYVEGMTPSYYPLSGHWTSHDATSVRFNPDGSVVVSAGVSAMGQGLVTMLKTVAAEILGVDPDEVRVVLGDTDRAPYGLGSWGSRGTNVSTGALEIAANEVIDKAIRIASHLLEAAPEDVELVDGRFQVRGSPRESKSWQEVSTVAQVRTLDLPEGVEPGLEATGFYDPPGLDHFPDSDGNMNATATYTNASQTAIVMVDLGTGQVKLLEYLVVHDCGIVINPMIVTGQVVGGVAQGIGGAMYETFHYDDYGNPQSTSFLDYHLPSSMEIPEIRVEHIETPAPTMPLGAKGCGEAGIAGPAATIAASVEEALSEFNIDEITNTPVTAPEVLRRLRGS